MSHQRWLYIKITNGNHASLKNCRVKLELNLLVNLQFSKMMFSCTPATMEPNYTCRLAPMELYHWLLRSTKKTLSETVHHLFNNAGNFALILLLWIVVMSQYHGNTRPMYHWLWCAPTMPWTLDWVVSFVFFSTTCLQKLWWLIHSCSYKYMYLYNTYICPIEWNIPLSEYSHLILEHFG